MSIVSDLIACYLIVTCGSWYPISEYYGISVQNFGQSGLPFVDTAFRTDSPGHDRIAAIAKPRDSKAASSVSERILSLSDQQPVLFSKDATSRADGLMFSRDTLAFACTR